MYQNCTVRLQVQKKEVRDILYGNGVQQGDNMVPILFIYIMMAASDTLRHQIGEEKPKFQYFPNSKKQRMIHPPTHQLEGRNLLHG